MPSSHQMIATCKEALWVNVGGIYFAALEATLRRSGTLNRLDSLDDLFVDRDPALFSIILQWLRTEQLSVHSDQATLTMLLGEADFYELPQLHADISEQLDVSYRGRRMRRE